MDIHIHPVECIAELVRVNQILSLAMDIHMHHPLAVAGDNNTRPMNYHQTNVIHQHGLGLQMQQSKEIAAKIRTIEKKIK